MRHRTSSPTASSDHARSTTTPRARSTASSHQASCSSRWGAAASHQASHAQPRSEPLSEPRRAPTTSTTDYVDHVPSTSAELRPPRPLDHVAMMIAAKNGATTTATIVLTTGQKARGPDNFIANDTSSHLSNIATRRLHPPAVNKAKYYF